MNFVSGTLGGVINSLLHTKYLFLKQIFEREKSSAPKPPFILPGSVIINIENPKSFNSARSIESHKLVGNVDNGAMVNGDPMFCTE